MLSEFSTEELVAEIRRREAATPRTRPEEILRITTLVSGVFGAPVGHVLGSSRLGELVEARFATWLILRDRGFSTPEIAVAFQRLDPGTIRHGCRTGRNWLGENRRFAKHVKQALDLTRDH